MEKEGTVHAETHLSTSESAGLRLLAPPLALQGVSGASRAPLEEGVASERRLTWMAYPTGMGPAPPQALYPHPPVPPLPCTPTLQLHPWLWSRVGPGNWQVALARAFVRKEQRWSSFLDASKAGRRVSCPGSAGLTPVQDSMGHSYLGPWKIRDTFFSSFLEAPVPQSISFLLPFLRKHILLWENETRELAPPGAEGR